jgi:hypothetical protein
MVTGIVVPDSRDLTFKNHVLTDVLTRLTIIRIVFYWIACVILTHVTYTRQLVG